MIMTLQEIMDTCSDWLAFCDMKGFSEFTVNEGGGYIQVELTIQEARELGIVTPQKITQWAVDDGDNQTNNSKPQQ